MLINAALSMVSGAIGDVLGYVLVNRVLEGVSSDSIILSLVNTVPHATRLESV